jgi:hypothetical protein
MTGAPWLDRALAPRRPSSVIRVRNLPAHSSLGPVHRRLPAIVGSVVMATLMVVTTEWRHVVRIAPPTPLVREFVVHPPVSRDSTMSASNEQSQRR